MLTHRDELRDRLAALVADLGGLHTVTAIGFEEGDRARVDEALSRVQDEASWGFVDLRGASRAAAAKVLAEHLDDGVLVVTVRPEALPRSFENLVGACIDKRA